MGTGQKHWVSPLNLRPTCAPIIDIRLRKARANYRFPVWQIRGVTNETLIRRVVPNSRCNDLASRKAGVCAAGVLGLMAS